ncbi:stage IV sporulation protein A [Candidatus Galacturonibacter soehngenii]|uniref:Stage IV sporulation protein A n=1 Tax=Candidatus Galacturonatibacter soehngenii TaxID=2307010 RepID=A0A7V7QMH3_9FIRM|nr:stage IV sporulation protein A [Candidatus Galacturonibacter soehngenii]KAB1439904.1 stage IV sporulation protein A [Candidatus Galacturonibacter soehngenii]MBA4685857.1 stage IV sporulation protein A [Candidatus Galacturonibacter soehngenii]
MELNKEFNLYKDIQMRTGGEIYIGVVGPVRTGKSTFIKRFMDLMVLPSIENEHSRQRTQDELPQSAAGKTIMTTEPKFIPKEAAHVQLAEDVGVDVRLIDCVGYMVDGATGHIEDNEERMVKTPWFDYEIPFTQAAELGTKKVINDHSTIGIVITCDGSFSEIPRENYTKPEEKTIMELKKLGKPFLVLVNSQRPYSEEALSLARSISEKYKVTAIPVNCEQLRKEDINKILENILYEFPISEIEFYIPKWVEMLPMDHKIKSDLVTKIKEMIQSIKMIKDANSESLHMDSEYIKRLKIDAISMATGVIKVMIEIFDKFYYEIISEMTGTQIEGEYQMIAMLKELAKMKKEYVKVLGAIESVRQKGYGVVTPEQREIILEEPVLIKHGNKYGVKIKAESPSIHMIRANIETEIAPIVGSEEQADDLIKFLKSSSNSGEGIWKANIFGKSVEQLVEDGIHSKIAQMSDDSQIKLQETMQKIVNDSNGGLVCIII